MVALRIARWGLLAVVFLATTGCREQDVPPDVPTAELGAEFTLAPGNTMRVDDDRVRVSFDKVSQDSRCPKDVDCVWEGDATVIATVTVGSTPSRQELHSNRRLASAAIVDGYRIELKTLSPEPLSSQSISPSDYRVALLVTRA
ncbi:hypothetical protein [Nocardia sp. NPDC051463]|uniref:hypothetical protein n=1 Tax=Nocardia sp. NPDC051463 TaxID=3154845 RepID=UPI003444BEEF